MTQKNLIGKQIVMIVAFNGFRDEEYFIPKEVLEKAGAVVKTASNERGIAKGSGKGEAIVDLLVSEIKTTDFDAVVFVGGMGCLENIDNEDSYKIIREAISEDRVLASICISPVILAKAGALASKTATVWTSFTDKSPAEILKKKGAKYQDEPIIVDGNIITANGPEVAEKFGEKIIAQLILNN